MTSHPPQQLQHIPIEQLTPHPANPNILAGRMRDALREHLRVTRRYPPVIVRRHEGAYQIIDGHQRVELLSELGESAVWCVVWNLDDHEVLLLLATLNRVHGEDNPARRTELLQLLAEHDSLARLVELLPETEAELSASILLPEFNTDRFVAELEARVARERESAPTAITFIVSPQDASNVEDALRRAGRECTGRNVRGQAFLRIVHQYLQQSSE